MSSNEAAPGTRITIITPDDFHHHVRQGVKTAHVLQHASPRFGRCLIMPNTSPPVTTTEQALEYKQHVLKSLPVNSKLEPLMTLYLTDKTSADEIRKAAAAGIVGCKYYPAGATTNSDFGVTDVKNCYPALEEMRKQNMMLCIHSEVTHADIFEREPVFIEEIMKPLVADFAGLKITMEHISTKQAVDYVLSAPDHVKASITVHHLLYNRNRKSSKLLCCCYCYCI
jgi:dihydroorotase